MKCVTSLTVCIAVLDVLYNCVSAVDQNIEEEEIRAQAYLDELNVYLIERRRNESIAAWNFNTNITSENQAIKDAISANNAAFLKDKSKEIRSFDFKSYKDENLKRQLKEYSKLGYAGLPAEKFKELNDALNAMESNYAKVHVCSFKNKTKCDLQLEPELTNISIESDDPEELKYYWKQWYDLAGTPTRKHFETYLRLNKEAAQLDNYTSGAESWLDAYEDPTIESQLENIFEEIRPLYQQIHAYVRHALKAKYGDLITEDGLIPMHLLGNMWGQTWDSVFKYTKPYPNKKSTDVTDEMKHQNYTALKMFQLGEQFYKSLNMSALPQTFWERSIIEKPNDGRELICHASAWDFYNGTDVRISQCTRVTMDELFTVFHEMGHVYYFLQYVNQPLVYRTGPNPGFHEAIGDVFALSASTPKFLEKIGLLKNYEYDEEAKINELYEKALQKIVFLPFAFSIDRYRWALFRGEVEPEEYNCRFWEMREQASGIRPPVQRYKEDFDPPAKYHISADVEYLRYMVSFIVQFQIYKGACVLAGEYDPNSSNSVLSDCDFYQSTTAGNTLKKMLALGASKPWPDALELITGQRKMEASALIEYFKPLQDWLERKNKETGAHIGWGSEFECLSKSDNAYKH